MSACSALAFFKIHAEAHAQQQCIQAVDIHATCVTRTACQYLELGCVQELHDMHDNNVQLQVFTLQWPRAGLQDCIADVEQKSIAA